MSEFNFEQYNRDVIRKAAREAGVMNTSYKSKDENIEAMKALGVVEISEGGHPVFATDAQGDAAQALIEQVAEDGYSEADEVADAAEPEFDPSGLPDVVLANDDPDYLDEILDQENHAAREPNEDTWVEDEVREFFDERQKAALAAEVGEAQAPARNYHLAIHADGRSSVTFVSKGDLVTVDSNHEAYLRVLEAILSGGDPEPWLNEAAQVEAIIESLSESGRLTLVFPAAPSEDDSKPVVLFDGEPIHGRMVDVFLRYHLEGRDASNLIKFLERAKANPVPGAAQQLFDWGGAVNGRLTINEDGFFVGYKSLHSTDEAGKYRPSHAGPGEVNGVPVEVGYLLQGIGDVVTIDPALVQPGPECSVGLHVGSWDYAARFGGDVKCEVLVDPADVVNIPPSDTGKMRVVRYTVAQIHENRSGYASHHEPVTEQPEVNLEVALLDADVPIGFWKRVLGRRRGEKATR